jgi:hypothetical protein
MRRSLFAFIGSVTLVTVTAWLPLAAQSAAPARPAASAPARPAAPAAGAAKKWTPARMADGHPDLQGVYDVATITPLERPAGVPSLTLTNQQAAALEEYEQQRNGKNLEPSRADRTAPPVGGDRSVPKSYIEILERAGGGAVGGYNTFWLAGGTRAITVDGQKRSSLIVDPPDGKVPPMKPEARRRNNALLAVTVAPDASEGAAAGPPGAFDGPELRPLSERCLLGFGSTSGPPTLPNYFYNNLKQIVQTPDSIMILNEMVHDVRIIRMGAKHLPESIRNWMGDSVGHWEGDTLVVDTTNFNSKTQFRGASDNLHIVERFTRVDEKTLLYRFTVDDPSTWDRSWIGEYPWVASSEPLYEYACHEGNYALGSILHGARLDEAEAAAKKNGQK